MKKRIMQFHATPTEIFEILCRMRTEIGFSLAIITWNPFSLTVVSKSECFNFEKILIAERKTFLRMFLSCRDTLLPADSEAQFFDMNPNCIVVDIGSYSQEGLGESSLSLISNDPEVLVFANKIFSKFKNNSNAGATVVNPDTNAETNLQSHRFTKGAKDLFDSGVKMLTVAGKCFLKFRDMSEPK